METQDQVKQRRQAPDGQQKARSAAVEIPRLTLNLWPDVGRALGLGRNSTFKAAKAGEIPTLRIGKRLLVPRAALEALLGSASTRVPAA